MSSIDNSADWPSDFCGKVRLFPLPNLVLFPHVVQPLHVFEPRYCAMLQDALASDSLIAMALLQPGWETSCQTRPKIAKTVCVGKVISHTPTEDGRHNILLVGLKRATILQELDTDLAFRTANVKVHSDVYPAKGVACREELMERLQRLFAHFVPDGLAAQESLGQLVGKGLPLGILTDTISYALNLPFAIKQQLLAESNVDVRCRLLIRCLDNQVRASQVDENCPEAPESFPPKFSDN